MPERWEEELAKVDRLQPSSQVRDKVGHVAPAISVDRSNHRILTITVVVMIASAAGLFAWRALSPIGTHPPEPLGTSDLPNVVNVTCAASGTEVSTPTLVSARGIRFEVSNPANLDEVIIQGTSGESASHAADIDLSSATEHTFDALPPGEYVVGCFSDRHVPRGDPETVAKAAGMQPIEILDPDHLYVSPALDCTGVAQDETSGFIVLKDGLTDLEATRMSLKGLGAEDVLEPSGYVALAEERLGTFRVVRDGRVIGSGRLLGEFNVGSPALSGYLDACEGSGLGFDNPKP